MQINCKNPLRYRKVMPLLYLNKELMHYLLLTSIFFPPVRVVRFIARANISNYFDVQGINKFIFVLIVEYNNYFEFINWWRRLGPDGGVVCWVGDTFSHSTCSPVLDKNIFKVHRAFFAWRGVVAAESHTLWQLVHFYKYPYTDEEKKKELLLIIYFIV